MQVEPPSPRIGTGMEGGLSSAFWFSLFFFMISGFDSRSSLSFVLVENRNPKRKAVQTASRNSRSKYGKANHGKALQACMNANTSSRKEPVPVRASRRCRSLALSDGGLEAPLTRLSCLAWHRGFEALLLLKTDSEDSQC